MQVLTCSLFSVYIAYSHCSARVHSLAALNATVACMQFSVHSSPATPPRHQHVSAFDWNQQGDQVLQVSCVHVPHACVCTYMCVYACVCVCVSSSCSLISLLTGIIQVVRSSDQFILVSSQSSLMLSLFMTTAGGRKDSP